MKCAADHSECFDAKLERIVYSRIWTMSTKLVFRWRVCLMWLTRYLYRSTGLPRMRNLHSDALTVHPCPIILKARRYILLALKSSMALTVSAVATVSAQQ